MAVDATAIVAAQLKRKSVRELLRGLKTHVDEFVADVPHYTNIEPELQIGEGVAAPASATE